MILHSCIDCGTKRMVRIRKGQPVNVRCRKCSKTLSREHTKWYDKVYSLGHPVKMGKELGYKVGGFYIFYPCADCGHERWVRFVKGKLSTILCPKCSSKRTRMVGSPVWNGGRRILHGYVEVLLPFDSPYLSMAGHKRNVLEHRLVIAQSLGRPLMGWEIVHHINHIKDDNRLENLQLVSNDTHRQITLLELENERLRLKIIELERR